MVIVMLQAVKKMHTEFFRVDTVNSPEFSFEDIPFFVWLEWLWLRLNKARLIFCLLSRHYCDQPFPLCLS
jgi:hypothetical protein